MEISFLVIYFHLSKKYTFKLKSQIKITEKKDFFEKKAPAGLGPAGASSAYQTA